MKQNYSTVLENSRTTYTSNIVFKNNLLKSDKKITVL